MMIPKEKNEADVIVEDLGFNILKMNDHEVSQVQFLIIEVEVTNSWLLKMVGWVPFLNYKGWIDEFILWKANRKFKQWVLYKEFHAREELKKVINGTRRSK